MEREMIERLAIDHAFGELNADAAALFEAYLAEHTDAKQWAEPMIETCDRTRGAIERKTRPDESVAWRETMRLRINRPAIVRWAAVIALSALVGITIGRWSRPQEIQSPETVVVRTAATEAGPDGWQRVLNEPHQGFWQSKALAMLQSQPQEIPTRPTPSTSSLWDRYRQFRKERSREEVY